MDLKFIEHQLDVINCKTSKMKQVHKIHQVRSSSPESWFVQ